MTSQCGLAQVMQQDQTVVVTVESTVTRQIQIQNQEIRFVHLRRLQGIRRIGGTQDPVSRRLQPGLQGHHRNSLVLDNKDGRRFHKRSKNDIGINHGPLKRQPHFITAFGARRRHHFVIDFCTPCRARILSRMNVCAIQHVACESPGLIADTLHSEGIRVQTICPFLNDPIPRSLDGVDGLVVMGGPMGVDDQDQFSFLKDEIRLIQEAVRTGTPVLGICLGSQLLAAALGAPVTRGPRKEIGWMPVTLTPVAARVGAWRTVPDRFTALHWHGDIFALPTGALPLASSELTRHQAFVYGRAAFGILFHLEVTEAIVAGMVAAFADELRETGVDGRQILAEAKQHLPGLGAIARTVFGDWTRLVKQSRSGNA